MEDEKLPFAHTSSDLANELIGRMSYERFPMDDLDTWTEYLTKKGLDPIGVLHATETIKHGGGIRMLLSFVGSNHPFLSQFSDEVVRMSLFRSAQETATERRTISAQISLGLLNRPYAKEFNDYTEDLNTEFTAFQKKLLERAAPSDPMMRK